jgi:hypothetical protein
LQVIERTEFDCLAMADMLTTIFVRMDRLVQGFDVGETQIHTETKQRSQDSAFHIAGNKCGLITPCEIDLRLFYTASYFKILNFNEFK